MAEISDDFPPVADVKRVRLIIRWQSILTDAELGEDLSGAYSIGLFMGDAPLFNALAYEGRAKISQQQERGFFHGESDGCEILLHLQRAATTNEIVVIEDVIEPWIKLVIGPDLFSPDKTAGLAETPLSNEVEILAVIQHGGPWEDGSMRYSGPAAVLTVPRANLISFSRELLGEALDPGVSNEASVKRLREKFGGELTA